LIGVTLVAYATHTICWVVHEIQGGAWVRWLELTYLVAMFVWVAGFISSLVLYRHLRRNPARMPISDERTNHLFLRAHQIALFTVLGVQLPFFLVTVPTNVLAQITVTSAVLSLFASYAWMDR
jgi:hypothetical protein